MSSAGPKVVHGHIEYSVTQWPDAALLLFKGAAIFNMSMTTIAREQSATKLDVPILPRRAALPSS